MMEAEECEGRRSDVCLRVATPDPHPCPYNVEINEDETPSCKCCDECARECAQDI